MTETTKPQRSSFMPMSRTLFERYFSDKKYGGNRKALKAASGALAELKEQLDGTRLVDGKLSKTTISKAKRLLASH